MSLFLLVLGAATTAAGFILVASGVILPEGTVGVEVVTPGTIAAVGGFILVGMGLTVRQLQHIERAIAVRLASGVVPDEVPIAPAAKPTFGAIRLPFPPNVPAGSSPPPLPPAARAMVAPVEAAALEIPPIKPPPLAPFGSAPVVEEADLSLTTQAQALADESVREVRDLAVIGRGGNGARPIRPIPRIVSRSRQPAAPDLARGAVFNAFWPAKSPAGAKMASTEIATSTQQPPALPSEPPPVSGSVAEIAPTAQQEAVEPLAPAPISILKSGVVEGMAYTLYSDGSIEAQLPQGTLRFGSIEALRNHIDGDA